MKTINNVEDCVSATSEGEEGDDRITESILTRAGRRTKRIDYNNLSKYDTQMHQEQDLITKYGLSRLWQQYIFQ